LRASSRRSLEVALQGVLVGLAAVVVWMALRGPAARSAPRAPASPPAGAASLREAGPVVRPVDPGRIRDVFRFADGPVGLASAGAGNGRTSARAAPAPEPTPLGPRLVGLVRRAGSLVAALAADGEVVLAGPGETVAGVTVLSIGEDGVRVRHADGREEMLLLP